MVGQLVRNPRVTGRLRANGVAIVDRDQIPSIATEAVMVTAHGAAGSAKRYLRDKGFTVLDATCPLVIRLHEPARFLEAKGCFPVVVGEENPVAVRGVLGNLRRAAVVRDAHGLRCLDGETRIGVVSQTTNPQAVAHRVKRRLLGGV